MDKIKKMSVVGLKALWFDQLTTMENAQKTIQAIREEMANRPISDLSEVEGTEEK